MEVDRETGNIAIIGDFGVAMLDPEAKTLLWQDAHGDAEGRVSVGESIVAALANKQVKVLDARGAEAALISMPSGEARDVAVDAANLQVVVTGARQGSPQNCPNNFEMAFVRAYAFEGNLLWRAYDWTDNDVNPNNQDLWPAPAAPAWPSAATASSISPESPSGIARRPSSAGMQPHSASS